MTIQQMLRVILSLAFLAVCSNLFAQEKLTVSYSSVDAPSANWYIAQEKGLYKKYGLDVESIFIPASSTNVAVLVAGQLERKGGVEMIEKTAWRRHTRPRRPPAGRPVRLRRSTMNDS